MVICNSWGSFLQWQARSSLNTPPELLQFTFKASEIPGYWEKWLIDSIDFSKVRKQGGMKQWIGNSKFPLHIHFLKGILRWLSRGNVSEFLNIKNLFNWCLKVTNAHIYIAVLASFGTEHSCLNVSKPGKLFRGMFQLLQLYFTCWTKGNLCRDICSSCVLCIFVCISVNDIFLTIVFRFLVVFLECLSWGNGRTSVIKVGN